jgi:hypothetical protein
VRVELFDAGRQTFTEAAEANVKNTLTGTPAVDLDTH